MNGDAAEGVASRADKLDTETRRALQEIDSYASASALAQERAALMGRADDLRMDLRDMQEQIREMEGAARGLQVAFQEAYRRPEEALRVWSQLLGGTRSAGSSGLGTASQILVASPERLGALRGASAFGFTTPARSEALRATARIVGHARAHQDAARRANRLGVFGEGQSEETALSQGVLKSGFSVEKSRYPGFSEKREEIEAIRKEATALAEKVRELTGGQPLSKQGQAVTEKVRSLAPKQRQALREVILGAGAPSVDKARGETGKSAPSGREAAARGSGPGRTTALKTPALKRSATARSTVRRGQPAKTAPSTAGTMEAGAMKGLLKVSLRHVAIHVAIRTLDRVEKEARGREMLEI
jgi:hypothetical protein